MMINGSMRAPTADRNSAVVKLGESPERESAGGTSALALMHTQEIQKHTRFGACFCLMAVLVHLVHFYGIQQQQCTHKISLVRGKTPFAAIII